MTRVYTDEWNGFQIRQPTYLDGHFEPHKFDLVKWKEHEPIEVVDAYTGEKKMSTRSCFSIGLLTWDSKGETFGFESVGLRYLQYRINGLEEFILDFCKTMSEQLTVE